MTAPRGSSDVAAAAPPRSRFGALVLATSIAYLGVVVLVALLLPVLGDRWWLGTLVLFGPRWLVAAPLAVLLPAALRARRSAVLLLVGAAMVVVFPVLGFVVPVATIVRAARPEDLRLVTFNAASRTLDWRGLKALVDAERLDLVVLEECTATREQLAERFPSWAVNVEEGLCLVSRFPVSDVAARDRADAWKRGGSGAMVRYTLAIPADPPARPAPRVIELVQVHLATPRSGLEALRSDRFKGIPEHDRNIEERVWESEIARQWVDAARHPVIVAGDFNMPVESAIYRRFWAGFDNAFSSAGLGFGGTKKTSLFRARIDHVLTGSGLEAERAWVGPELGSDHLPMIAALRFSP